ncbi:MAG: helix-turn-helix domain-containing protein [Sulfurospirillaceae bacterium]|nr:helix-turn-helix domain-containing protein [Sulfurospirillaceae bacterium]
MMETSTTKDWLNPNEVSKQYGFSVSTLAKWRMKNKHLPFSKIGKYIKYKRADIEAFLNSNIINADEVA